MKSATPSVPGSVFLLVPACVSIKEKLLWGFWNPCDDGTLRFLGHLPEGQGPGSGPLCCPIPSWDAGESGKPGNGHCWVVRLLSPRCPARKVGKRWLSCLLVAGGLRSCGDPPLCLCSDPLPAPATHPPYPAVPPVTLRIILSPSYHVDCEVCFPCCFSAWLCKPPWLPFSLLM